VGSNPIPSAIYPKTTGIEFSPDGDAGGVWQVAQNAFASEHQENIGKIRRGRSLMAEAILRDIAPRLIKISKRSR
jgi:hypothetical protein